MKKIVGCFFIGIIIFLLIEKIPLLMLVFLCLSLGGLYIKVLLDIDYVDESLGLI